MPGEKMPARRVPATLFIGEAEASVPLGQSRDVSISGMFVMTAKRPEVGSEHDIWFIWGDETYGTRARVARHDETGIGLEFVKPDPTFVQALQEIVGTGEFRVPKLDGGKPV